MTKGERLFNKLSRKIDEEAFEDDEMYGMLTDGLMMVAERLKLPALQISDEVTVPITENYIAMPSDYHHGLYHAFPTDTKKPLVIVDSMATMLQRVGAEYAQTGDIGMVCEHGINLMCNRVPTAATDITLFYYRKPAAITYRTISLDGVPASIEARIDKAIVHYAAYLFFEDLENGIEGEKIDMNHNLTIFESIIEEVAKTLAPISFRPPPVIAGNYL